MIIISTHLLNYFLTVYALSLVLPLLLHSRRIGAVALLAALVVESVVWWSERLGTEPISCVPLVLRLLVPNLQTNQIIAVKDELLLEIFPPSPTLDTSEYNANKVQSVLPPKAKVTVNAIEWKIQRRSGHQVQQQQLQNHPRTSAQIYAQQLLD